VDVDSYNINIISNNCMFLTYTSRIKKDFEWDGLSKYQMRSNSNAGKKNADNLQQISNV